MIRAYVPVLLALMTLLPLPVTAQVRAGSADAQLLRARDRFDYGDYNDSVRILRRLLDEGRLVSEPQLVEAYRLLGVSLFYAGNLEESRAAFVRLLSVEPDFRLDPFFHPPKLVEFFDAARADNEALLAPLRDQRKRLEEQRRLEEEARRRLLEDEERRRLARQRVQEPAVESDEVIERVVSDHTYIVTWLPFGAGQFQNQEPAKGAALAIAQIITGAASILGYAFVATAPRCVEVELPKGSALEPTRLELRCGVPSESMNLVRNMDRMKWLSGAAFWGLVGYGVLDAHLGFEPQRVISERRVRFPSNEPPMSEAERPNRHTDDDDASRTPRPDGPTQTSHSFLTPSNRSLELAPWALSDGLGASLTLRF